MLSHSSKNKKAISIRSIIYYALIWLLLFCFLGYLVWTNIKIKQRREKLAQTVEALKKEIQALENKNQNLKNEIGKVETKEYLEKIAREKFNMKSPGEQVVVISKEGQEKEIEIAEQEIKQEEKKINWYNPLNWLSYLSYKLKIAIDNYSRE